MPRTALVKFPSRFIRAGAGAGKTTALVNAFFEFVKHHREVQDKFPRVVITTFTRKATQELKERLLLHALKLQDPELFEFINKKSSVHISTIHGVLSLFLARHHDLIGLSSDIQVLDPLSLAKVYFKELKRIVRGDPAYLQLLDHYGFKDLTRLTVQAHQFFGENQIVQGGPTQIRFADEADMLKIRQAKIQKFIRDMEQISSAYEQMAANKAWVTYLDFLKDFQEEVESAKDFTALYQKYLTRPDKPRFFENKPAFDTSVHEIIASYFSKQANYFGAPDTDQFIENSRRLNALFHQLLLEFNLNVNEIKRKTGNISINDLESLSLKLMTEHPEVSASFAEQYDFFMVDEYQDTSPLQVKILNAMTLGRPQFTVGDPQQSIYLFRGARSEVFMEKQKEAIDLQDQIIDLLVNYRSEPKLMRCLNDITHRFSTQFRPMEPKSEMSDQFPTQAFYVETHDENDAVVNQIYRLRALGADLSDICVLMHKNSEILQFAKFAQSRHLPVQPLIAAGFDRKREILDLVSFLRFLVNPHDDDNLVLLLRSPWLSMLDDELYRIRQDGLRESLWVQLRACNHPDYGKLKTYMTIYYESGVVEALQSFVVDSQFLISSQFLDPSGQREANIYKFLSSLRTETSEPDFLLNEYVTTHFGSFQEDLSSNLNEAVPLFIKNRVAVMTIHGSKGLQFKHVILPGVGASAKVTRILHLTTSADESMYSVAVADGEDATLTSSNWAARQKEMLNEKERLEYERLFYVAVTRAERSVAFIVDVSKKPIASSWYYKMDWPIVGGENHTSAGHTSGSAADTGRDYQIELINEVSHLEAEPIAIKSDATAPVERYGSSSNGEPESANQARAVSVTELVSAKESSQKNTNPLQVLENLHKANKGTQLHRVFESMKYLSLNSVLALITETEKKGVEFLIQQTKVPFSTILKEGFTEWGFGLRTKWGTIQGQIDLWGRIHEDVYILDYKTGASAHSQQAMDQLSWYAQCLKKMKLIKPADQVYMVILYPFEQKVVVEKKSFMELGDI